MGDEPYDRDAARQALILLREAHDQWTALLPRALGPGQDMRDPEWTLRTLHQHAASVLTWARGLDDMCDEPDGLSANPANGGASYVERKQTAEMGGMLDAAIYACNRVIHQLIAWRLLLRRRLDPLVVPAAVRR